MPTHSKLPKTSNASGFKREDDANQSLSSQNKLLYHTLEPIESTCSTSNMELFSSDLLAQRRIDEKPIKLERASTWTSAGTSRPKAITAIDLNQHFSSAENSSSNTSFLNSSQRNTLSGRPSTASRISRRNLELKTFDGTSIELGHVSEAYFSAPGRPSTAKKVLNDTVEIHEKQKANRDDPESIKSMNLPQMQKDVRDSTNSHPKSQKNGIKTHESLDSRQNSNDRRRLARSESSRKVSIVF